MAQCIIVDHVLFCYHIIMPSPLRVYLARLHRHRATKLQSFIRLYKTQCTLMEGNSPSMHTCPYNQPKFNYGRNHAYTSFSRLYASDTHSFSWSLVVISIPCMPALRASKPPYLWKRGIKRSYQYTLYMYFGTIQSQPPGRGRMEQISHIHINFIEVPDQR